MSKTNVQSADKAAKTTSTGRKLVFVSKATPGDDDFVLWLAPRLEGAGYEVFADILNLEGGSRWRREVTERLQYDAVKMLLCCRDSSLAREGVQEEIGIATDLASELKDPKFIIPLRLERYKKLFGIGGLQWVDFTRGWAQGLEKLLETLRRQKIPQSSDRQINANWEFYRRRNAISIKQEPERLTSNWLRIVSVPEAINYLEPSGAVDRFALEQTCKNSKFPIELHGTGIYSFGSESEVNQELIGVGRFKAVRQIECISFVKNGCGELVTARQEASNLVHSAFRQAWIQYCRTKKLTEYQYSNAIGFHISDQQAKIGQKVVWGRQGEKRSSMLRNAARGHVWNFGVNAIPAFWPFPAF